MTISNQFNNCKVDQIHSGEGNNVKIESDTKTEPKKSWLRTTLWSIFGIFLLGGAVDVFWNLVAGYWQPNFDEQVNKVEQIVYPVRKPDEQATNAP